MTPAVSAKPSLDGMADHENPDHESRGPLPLWLTVVLGVAGSAVALWGVRAASPLLGPILLAFVLTVLVHPLIGALVRRGMRKGLAVAIAVVVLDGGLILFGIALVVSVGQLATVLPEYANEWQAALAGLRDTLKGLGFGPEQVEQALRSVEPSTVLSALAGLLSRLAGTIGALVLVLATALFMTAEAAGVPERLAEVPGTAHLHAALAGFARNTRRYLVVTSIFGFAVAVVDTVALVLMGIPLPLVWGLLSFLTNYVPNIGFFLGLAPPALLGFLVGGPALGLLVIVVYSVVNFVLQSVVQPVFVGDAVNLSVTLSFLSVIAWTVVLGPIGAILAVPMTLFVHAILVGQDPDRRWARVLLAGASGEATTERRAAGRRPGGRRAGRAPTAPRPESPGSQKSPGSHSAPGTGQAG